MTNLDELDEKIRAHISALIVKLIMGGAAFLLANLVVFAGIIWWASALDAQADRNTETVRSLQASLADLSSFAERQARFEVMLSSIDDRTRRIEGQIDDALGSRHAQ